MPWVQDSTCCVYLLWKWFIQPFYHKMCLYELQMESTKTLENGLINRTFAFIFTPIFCGVINPTYCWWTKSCTTKDDDYPIIYRVLTIPGGAGFCPSTVWLVFRGPILQSDLFRDFIWATVRHPMSSRSVRMSWTSVTSTSTSLEMFLRMIYDLSWAVKKDSLINIKLRFV